MQCAAAYRFSGDRRFARRAIAEMLSVCAWPTWNCEHYLDTAEFALVAKGPSGMVFNYSDCGATSSYVWYSPLMAYFAAKAKQPAWCRLERRRLGHAVKGQTVNPLYAPASLWTLLWMDFDLKDDPSARPYPFDYVAHGANPIAILRSSYDSDAFFLCCMGH